LAQALYNDANNTINFEDIATTHDELIESLEALGLGPHIILMDLNET
jgi:hypothetical protein